MENTQPHAWHILRVSIHGTQSIVSWRPWFCECSFSCLGYRRYLSWCIRLGEPKSWVWCTAGTKDILRMVLGRLCATWKLGVKWSFPLEMEEWTIDSNIQWRHEGPLGHFTERPCTNCNGGELQENDVSSLSQRSNTKQKRWLWDSLFSLQPRRVSEMRSTFIQWIPRPLYSWEIVKC